MKISNIHEQQFLNIMIFARIARLHKREKCEPVKVHGCMKFDHYFKSCLKSLTSF